MHYADSHRLFTALQKTAQVFWCTAVQTIVAGYRPGNTKLQLVDKSCCKQSQSESDFCFEVVGCNRQNRMRVYRL